MKPCTCADQPCHREATLVARLAGVGDRPLSRECFDRYVAIGMNIRELASDVVVPEWRQRDLRRDNTSRLLGLGVSARRIA